MAELYIDADSVPVRIRAVILRRAMKLDADSYFVADRPLPDVLKAIEDDKAERRRPYRDTLDRTELRRIGSRIHMIVIETGENSADNEIVAIAKEGSLAITHDIPLAARLLGKGVYVIDDRGGEYTSDDIRTRLSSRANNAILREMGVFTDRSGSFDEKAIREFSARFDKMVSRLF